MPPGVRVGARATLRVDDLAFGGDGVGRMDDFVVFVPWVIPGETAEVEITEVKKNYARARLLRLIEASPDRVTPVCRYYGECGGCQYQHVAYAAQLRLKQRQVADLMERLGGFSRSVVEPTVPCPQPYGYRNRLMLRSQWDKLKQGLNLGFLRGDSRLVVDVEECALAEPQLNEQIRHARQHPPPRGGLKLMMRLLPEGWQVPRDSFFQNNRFLLPKLVETVRDSLSASGCRFLVDTYCGVGFFAIELADLLESFVGVEIDKPAIQAARHNARQRGRLNGEFVLGTTEHWLPQLLERFPPQRTAVVLDPPRRGCDPASLSMLRELHPAQVIHISCHPATLARDLQRLCAEGRYELRRVVPLDMFPQTQHVECVADLRWTGESAGRI